MMCLHFIYFSVRANRTYQWCMLPQKRKFNDEVVQSDQSNLLITQNKVLSAVAYCHGPCISALANTRPSAALKAVTGFISLTYFH